MKKVVFLGDFNVDIILDNLESMPVADREVRCGSFDLAIGSSACIAACAYASLGGSAWFCGLAGETPTAGSFTKGSPGAACARTTSALTSASVPA